MRPEERETSPGEVTKLLQRWTAGEQDALDELVPLVYSELRRVSRALLRRRPRESFQTSDLINEAFVRLMKQNGQNGIDWRDRAHFFGIAARTMRNILVDRSRRRHAQKRGGGAGKAELDEAVLFINPRRDEELLALDDALTTLSTIDRTLGRLVELRFFGGLNVAETAEVMGTSKATVKRGWQTAKLWFRRELQRG